MNSSTPSLPGGFERRASENTDGFVTLQMLATQSTFIGNFSCAITGVDEGVTRIFAEEIPKLV